MKMTPLIALLLVLVPSIAGANFRATEIRNDTFGIRDYGKVVNVSQDYQPRKYLNISHIKFIGSTRCLKYNKVAKVVGRRCNLVQGQRCVIRDYLMKCY